MGVVCGDCGHRSSKHQEGQGCTVLVANDVVGKECWCTTGAGPKDERVNERMDCPRISGSLHQVLPPSSLIKSPPSG